MKTLWCVAVLCGVLLPSSNGQTWDLEKMRKCPCAHNVTREIVLAVARGCITDPQGRRATLRLSPSDTDGCTANVMDRAIPGEINVFMTYNGRLEDGTKRSPGKDGSDMEREDYPDGEMEFSYKVDVENGTLSVSDSTNPVKKSGSGMKIRKRELMPFNMVNFNIIIRTDQEVGCDVKDQTRTLLVRGIKRYWLKMTNCLLDVTN